MWKSFSGFFLSATYPFQTLNILRRQPRLWGYLLIPILLNLVIGICLYVGLLFVGLQGLEQLLLWISDWVEQQLSNLPEWLSYLRFLVIGFGWLLRILLVVLALILVGYITLTFGAILGAPWYGQLSEKMEKQRTGEVHTMEVGIIRDIWRALMFEVKKLLLTTVIGLPLFFFSFVPVIGAVVATVGGTTLTATIVCLDFIDGPSERRRFSFRKKLSLAWGSFPASASFSLVCLALISVPLLNFITIPLCVASGTLFWCDRILPKLPPRDSKPELKNS